MRDLQEIERGLYENDGINGDHSFNIEDHDNFNVGSISNSHEFNLNEDVENCEKEDSGETPQNTNSTVLDNIDQQKQPSSILEILNCMTEVDAEVRTTVPDKMLNFLFQYGKMNGWKMVQISNYLLLKIPESNESVVEYALKFDQMDEKYYALKFLKNETISTEQFHSVG